jgi:uncharacterized protein YjbJ (UPF0337 family)
MQKESNAIWDQMAGQWKQFSGHVRKAWGKLTDDDIEQIKGQRDILAGRIQERYGITREEANRQIQDWADKLKL